MHFSCCVCVGSLQTLSFRLDRSDYFIKVSVTVQGVGMFMRLFEKSYKV